MSRIEDFLSTFLLMLREREGEREKKRANEYSNYSFHCLIHADWTN